MAKRSVHSATFDIFHRAILAEKQIRCVYDGYSREVCPYVLGHKAGKEVALVYQFGGSSSRGLPPGGDWRCFYLADVLNAQSRSGPWRGDAAHRKRQQCVDDVYIDVNLAVLNQPGRQKNR